MKVAGIEALGLRDYVTTELRKSKGDMTFLFENHKKIMDKFGRTDVSLDQWKQFVKSQRDRMKDLKIAQEVRDMEIEDVGVNPQIVRLDSRLKASNKEARALYRMASSAISVEESNARAVTAIQEIIKKSPNPVPPMKVEVSKVKPTKNMQTVLLLSDSHYGEVILPPSVHGGNQYNCEEAQKRFLQLFAKTVEFSDLIGSDSLHILSLGDTFSGVIHPELWRTAEYPIFQQITELSAFFASVLKGLVASKVYKTITMHCVVGNHGRTDPKPVHKNAHWENHEAVFYHMLAAHFNECNEIKIEIAEATSMISTIGGVRFRLEHGNNYKGGGGKAGVPVQNIAESLTKYDLGTMHMEEMQYDVATLGHFHTPASFYTSSHKQVYANGSMIGPNEFAAEKCHSNTPAVQTVLAVDGNKKDIVASSLLWLT